MHKNSLLNAMFRKRELISQSWPLNSSILNLTRPHAIQLILIFIFAQELFKWQYCLLRCRESLTVFSFFLKLDSVSCVQRLKKGSFKRSNRYWGWTELLGEAAGEPLEDHS